MVSTRVGVVAWRRMATGVLVAAALAAPSGLATAATLAACLPTGYALQGGRSAAVYFGAEPAWILDPSGGDAFCDLPREDGREIAGPRGAAMVAYRAGTGISVATAAIGNEEATQPNQAYFDGSLLFEFRALPDVPARRSRSRS